MEKVAMKTAPFKLRKMNQIKNGKNFTNLKLLYNISLFVLMFCI